MNVVAAAHSSATTAAHAGTAGTPATAVPKRLLGLVTGPSLPAHQQIYGPLPDTATLISEIEASGLTGRGGAGFETARKIASLHHRPAVVIANGSEGEPLSAKDARLLQSSPHLVLDGLRLLGDALAPRSPLQIMVHPHAENAVRRAVADRPDRRRFHVEVAVDRFVSGEATAVASAVAGRAQIPTDHRHHLTADEQPGGPVLLQNVETLAHIALIARYGAAWFRSVGTTEDPGTRLLTVGGTDGTRRVIEAAGGSTLASALLSAGIDPAATQAVLVGGYHGRWIVPDRYSEQFSSREVPGRIACGAGVLIALGHQQCGLAVSAGVLDHLAEQTSGQCGPCVLGLPRLSDAMRGMLEGRGDSERMRRLMDAVVCRGACHHPDGTARLAASVLDVFAADIAAHAAGTCTGAAR